MKDLEPRIFRQRLIIEGKYKARLDPDMLRDFINDLSGKIQMTIIYGPVVKDLGITVNPIHEGYECQCIWAESGLSLYTWKKFDFFTLDIYTCKRFDVKIVVNLVREAFHASQITYKSV